MFTFKYLKFKIKKNTCSNLIINFGVKMKKSYIREKFVNKKKEV